MVSSKESQGHGFGGTTGAVGIRLRGGVDLFDTIIASASFFHVQCDHSTSNFVIRE
jgi:hypothetical protein